MSSYCFLVMVLVLVLWMWRPGSCSPVLYANAIRKKANLGKVKGISLTSKGRVLDKSIFSSGGNKMF